MLQISHLYADYGGKPALEDINLTLESGELLVVLGPSGCGKTTLLNLIAGFVPYQHGSIQLAGKRIEGPGAERGVVFQNEGLLPWRNVQDNVAFGLQLAGIEKMQRLEIVHQMLKKVGLEGAEKRYIWQLSGGQRQRVGIARALAALQLISPLFLPPPQQVLAKLLTIAGPQGFMDATLWQHLAASLTRIVLALLAAVVIGIPVGIAMGLSPTVRGILDPVIELYRPVPPLAYLPLMVIWFGIGETSKILLIYLAIFAPVAMSALAGVKSAQQVRIRAAQSLGASRAQVLWFVILPGALPEILTGLRIGLGVGWSTLVAAELIAATRGLGFMVQSAGEFLATDVVLAGIAVIAIIAFLLELGLRALQRRLTPWHGEVQ